jgi:hypothetical protein
MMLKSHVGFMYIKMQNYIFMLFQQYKKEREFQDGRDKKENNRRF